MDQNLAVSDKKGLMSKNWIIEEAKKADGSKDTVILENPKTKVYLDHILLEKFWPTICSCFEGSGYNYSFEPHLESELSQSLERSIVFMLFDGNRAFFKGKLRCSMEHWMIDSNFFLPLSADNDPRVLFEILGNSRFKGNSPTLMVNRERDRDYFQIDFHNGRGESWTQNSEQEIEDELKKIIKVNLEMHVFSHGGITLDEVGKFLTIAYDVYESF